MSQLSPESHNKTLTEAVAGTPVSFPRREGAKPVQGLPTQQPLQPSPALLLAITALMKHLQLINLPPPGPSPPIKGMAGCPHCQLQGVFGGGSCSRSML